MKRHIAGNVVTVIFTAAICAGLVPPARAGDRRPSVPDASVLSEIAENVRRRALTGPKKFEPISISPRGTAAPDRFEGKDIEPSPDAPFSHIAPAQEGITVTAPPRAGLVGQSKPEPGVGYQSNSWRGRKHPGSGLGLSSGVLAPASGLDPALQAQSLATRGRPFVYGFVRLNTPRDEALEQHLAAFGVRLLGPHDDHHKARLPVGSLAALASTPEVAWIGVSPPDLKVSEELAAVRGPQGKQAGIAASMPIPIIINLFEGDETGLFRRELEALGATVAEYDPELESYRAVATAPVIEKIAGLDFVLFLELMGLTTPGHDQSMSLVDADAIRPGTPLGHTRFSAATVTLGIMDTGFDVGRHVDLNKFGCGHNFTDDEAGAFIDEHGHGTHILGTIAGTGTGNPLFKGVATGLGSIDRIRAAKVWRHNNSGEESWLADAMDWMSEPAACGSVAPEVINLSGGWSGPAQKGTDSLSRKLDHKVWTFGQSYVVCAGNEGTLAQSIRRPGVAKNALTVGMVHDWGYHQAGDRAETSSTGPTGDGRMKPNLVAPGTIIKSAKAGTTNEYFEKDGCSMATPHVTGLAATLMDHYPDFRGRPALLRAHMMATAISHDDVTGWSDEYGMGRASGYLSHWDHPNSAGWQTFKFWGHVNSQGYQYNDITVPPGTKRLIVVLTWDEPAASAGANRAVTYDLDLWVDHEATCPFTVGDCGDYQSVSFVDNVEYIVVDNPPPGLYRMKAHPFNAPTFNLPYGMVAHIIRGETKPTMMTNVTVTPEAPRVGTTFTVTLNVNTFRYLISGVYVDLPGGTPPGLTLRGFSTTRHDGVTMNYMYDEPRYTLGNVVPMLGRTATWTFRADAPGPKTFGIQLWSENAGDVTVTKTVDVVTPVANLAETAVAATPSSPVRTPGSAFSISDTVQNFGDTQARSSTTRYYLSLDAVKSADDKLLNGTRSIPALAAGAVHSGTVNVTIPTATPLNTYFLLACADDRGGVVEDDEGNNCAVAPGTVTVTRPDLVANVVSSPPATVARGARFAVTDTTQNGGTVVAPSSRTRYYLSLDGVKSANDKALSTDRKVPELAGGGSHSGTVTVTIPTSTLRNTYFVLACADGKDGVAETIEANNCVASSTTVTITP